MIVANSVMVAIIRIILTGNNSTNRKSSTTNTSDIHNARRRGAERNGNQPRLGLQALRFIELPNIAHDLGSRL